MKNLLLVIFFVNNLYSYAVRLQIDFVQNFNIYVVSANPNFPGQGNTTSDVAINSILNAYNVTQCFNTHDGYNGNYHVLIFIDYNGSNVIGLISDLLANPNLNKVRPCGANAPGNYTYANKLYVKLLNASNGNPTGTNVNLNIVTTNASLNSIFDKM